MDYYTELGLSPAASAEEIRQAYRQLARLMHPDQQLDEGVKRLAEIQMIRLNEILAVLGNPSQRRRYDRSIGQRDKSVMCPAVENTHWARWIWLGAALVGCVTIAVFFAYYGASGPARIERQPLPQVAPAPAPENARPRTPGTQDQRPRRVAPGRAHPASTKSDQNEVKLDLPSSPPALVIQQPQPALALPSPLAPAPRAPGFGGDWLYVPTSRSGAAKNLYAPEYIELKVTDDSGRVQGLYRARYVVTNRAISPAVVFHFEGPATAPLCTLKWDGPGGAYGRVTLKLVGENSLEVRWTATRLSEELGLISGVATLVRRLEP